MTPAPVFGDTGKHWSIGSIVRGHWWVLEGYPVSTYTEVRIVGTVERLHSVNGDWIATLHYDNEDVGDGVPFEFPVAQVVAVERACGL